MKKTISLMIMLFLFNFTAFAGKMLTNWNTGTSIFIESSEGMTKITDLSTGEQIEINGEYEYMNDQEYTLLMKEKVEIKPFKQENYLQNNEVSFNFNFQGQYTEVTAYQMIDKDTLNIEVYSVLGGNSKTGKMSITLYQDQIFWPFDKEVGTKEYDTDYRGSADTDKWTGLTKDRYHRVKMAHNIFYSNLWGKLTFTW